MRLSGFVPALLAVSLGSSSLAQPAQIDHYDAVNSYVTLMAMATYAEGACPGIKADKVKLLMIRTVAKISDGEEKMVEAELLKKVAMFNGVVQKDGALKWCSSAWALLGPSGSLLPQILSRP